MAGALVTHIGRPRSVFIIAEPKQCLSRIEQRRKWQRYTRQPRHGVVQRPHHTPVASFVGDQIAIESAERPGFANQKPPPACPTSGMGLIAFPARAENGTYHSPNTSSGTGVPAPSGYFDSSEICKESSHQLIILGLCVLFVPRRLHHPGNKEAAGASNLTDTCQRKIAAVNFVS